MPPPRRLRTRVVEDTSTPEPRASTALRRRLKQTDAEIPQRGRRAASSTGDQVVSAPNTDNPLGEVIDKARWDMRPARPGNLLHISDLLHKCTRKKALEKRYGSVGAQQRLTMSDMITFAMGDAVHDTVKDRSRIGSPDKVWGIWSCKCKFLLHDDPCVYSAIDQEETCPHCKTLVNHYNEVSMEDEEYGVVGNPDLILYFARKDAFMVTEIKSMAPKQWEELKRPDPTHVLQVIFYWHLMHRKGYRLCDRVSIFYVTKGWQFGDKCVYKEFLIDPVASLDRLNSYIEEAKAYKACLTSKNADLPARNKCGHRETKDAKSCAQVDLCWDA